MPLRKLQEIIIAYAQHLFTEGRFRAVSSSIEYPCNGPAYAFKRNGKRLELIENTQELFALPDGEEIVAPVNHRDFREPKTNQVRAAFLKFQYWEKKIHKIWEDDHANYSYKQGSMRIGASTTPGMYVVPKLIARFRNQHPKIAVRVGIKNTYQIEEGLINNEFDLGFVGGHIVGDEIETLSWRTDELVLIVSPGHPLAYRKQIKPGELVKETFINREPGSATRAVVEQNLQRLGLRLEASLELGNPETVKLAVKDGLGIAILSKSAIEMELKTISLVAVKVQGLRISRELKIIYRKGKHLSRAANALIETAQQLP